MTHFEWNLGASKLDQSIDPRERRPRETWRANLGRAVRRLGLPLVGAMLLASYATAQDLLIVQGDKTMLRVEGANVTTVPIAGLGADERIVAAKRNFSITMMGGSVLVYRVVTYDEYLGIHRAYTLDLSGAPTAINGCDVDQGEWWPADGTIAGYASNSNQFQPPNAFTAMIDQGGNLYGGPSCTVSPGSGYALPFLPANGEIVGVTTYGNDLIVLRRSASQTILSRVRYPDMLVGGNPTIIGTWNITDLTGSIEIMGIGVDCTGRLWAHVNRPGSCFGHGWGDFLLAKTDETLASPSLTLRTHQDIGDWFNPLVGCLYFPGSFLFFEFTPPQDIELTGATSVVGCESATLTASWEGGQPTGIVNPGNIEVDNGEQFAVTPGYGASQAYTLTVAGLTCQNGSSAAHTVTSAAITIADAEASDPTCCVGNAVTFSATVSNQGANPTYAWKTWNGTSTGATVATGNPSTPFTPTGDGEYVLVVEDDCNVEARSAAVAVDFQEPADVGTPTGGGTICKGSTATLSFPISGDPTPKWRLWSGGVVRAECLSACAAGPVTYTTPPLTADAVYVLEVWNDCNGNSHVVSTDVSIEVQTPPSLTSSPPSSIVQCAGLPLTLTASATGDAPLTYEWRRNGVLVGTSSTYSLASATSADSGTYTVVVSNVASASCGTAQAQSIVSVIGQPIADADLGTDVTGVDVAWAPIQGAGAYVLYRADEIDGTGKHPLTSWTSAVSYFDASAIPGHSYYYSVIAAKQGSGAGACAEGLAVEGWRAITPPTLSIAYTFPDSFAVATWNAPAGSGFYQIYRRIPGDPSSEVPVTGWIGQTTFNITGEAFETYEFYVRAAIDSVGTHASANGNAVVQTMPCTQAGQVCGEPAAPGMLILIDRSWRMLAPTINGTRWNDAVVYAKQEVAAFFSNCPDGSVAIWTFAGACVEDLTTGFVGQAEANVVLDALPSVPSATLGAPLAKAMCESIGALCTCIGSGASCSISTGAGPKDAVLLVLTEGTNDFVGGSFCDSATNATSGTNCSSDPFLPANSWERKVCNLLNGVCPAVYALIWDDPFSAAPIAGSAMHAFAAKSGGLARTVLDGDPLPEPFFGDCNGNGVADALDIQTGSSSDCNQDGAPDECQSHLDCNSNGAPDSCDVLSGASLDLNGNGAADECEGFALTAPVLPLAGVFNEFHVVGGTPHALVRLTAELGGAAPFSSSAGGHQTSGKVARAAIVLPIQRLDANGHARFQFDIPAQLAGSTLLYTAVETSASHQQAQLSVAFH